MQNGPWIALIFAGIFTLTNIAVRQGAQVYYLKYFVGDDGTPLFLIFDKTAIFLSLGTLAMLVGVTFTKALSERFDKRHLMIVLSLLNALSLAVFLFVPADQYWLMVAINVFGNLVAGWTVPGPQLPDAHRDLHRRSLWSRRHRLDPHRLPLGARLR